MLPIQEFCIDNIYCAPRQDKQFHFRLNRVNKPENLVRDYVYLYNTNKRLPDSTNQFIVFTIGNLNPGFLNLLAQDREWLRDVWINFADDMSVRNYTAKMYNQDGVMYPIKYCYYSFIDESSIVIAIMVNQTTRMKYNLDSIKFLHVYSNTYFNTLEYNQLSNRIGIDYRFKIVENNADKVELQNFVNERESHGGRCIIYVDGMYTDKMTLLVPDYSIVEVIYDQSIIFKVKHRLDSLRTYISEVDSRQKYLVFNNISPDRIHYYDDTEIYVTTTSLLNSDGVYFYNHKDFVTRNITDKDYGLVSSYVNTQANYVSSKRGGSIVDKQIVMFIRKSGLLRTIKYSNLKLHELYKVPSSEQLNVLLGTHHTLTELRVEKLEASNYFKVASASNLIELNKNICSDTVGYNAVCYYYGKNYSKKTDSHAEVPYLYRNQSTVFEYDSNGKYLGVYTTTGPIYLYNNPTTRYLEYVQGVTPGNFGKYYENTDTITLGNGEYVLLSAHFNYLTRLSNWEDVTNNYTPVSGTITLNEADNKKVKVVYLNQPNIYSTTASLTNGNILVPIMVKEDRGTGYLVQKADVPYSNIEVYLNGYRLTYGLDFFINFPDISICNKKYIDYTLPEQDIQIRAYGLELDPTKINSLETNGFINHGVFTRNGIYDIRDDRNFTVYVNGKMFDKSLVKYAEEDNTVRIDNPLNGLPYTIKEPFISIKQITGLATLPMYRSAKELDKKFSEFFTQVLPEPSIDQTNVIPERHYIYSPVVSTIINDVLTGSIPSSTYTTPYNDFTITNLLDTTYRHLVLLDPIKHIQTTELIEIHPHLGNTVVNLNLHQYRFIQNLVRLFAGNRINLSGYLAVSN